MGYEEDVMAAAAKLVLTDNILDTRVSLHGIITNMSQDTMYAHQMMSNGLYHNQDVELTIRVRINSPYDIENVHRLFGGTVRIQGEDYNGQY